MTWSNIHALMGKAPHISFTGGYFISRYRPNPVLLFHSSTHQWKMFEWDPLTVVKYLKTIANIYMIKVRCSSVESSLVVRLCLNSLLSGQGSKASFQGRQLHHFQADGAQWQLHGYVHPYIIYVWSSWMKKKKKKEKVMKIISRFLHTTQARKRWLYCAVRAGNADQSARRVLRARPVPSSRCLRPSTTRRWNKWIWTMQQRRRPVLWLKPARTRRSGDTPTPPTTHPMCNVNS